MSLTPRHSEPDGNSRVKNLFFIEILRAKALRMTYAVFSIDKMTNLVGTRSLCPHYIYMCNDSQLNYSVTCCAATNRTVPQRLKS